MAVPYLTTFSAGIGTFAADWGNTVIEGGALLANLRSFTGLSNMNVWMLGTSAANDGGQGMFYWNSTATAADDAGVTTITPNGVSAGRWLRQSGSTYGTGQYPLVFTQYGADPTGTITCDTAWTNFVNAVMTTGIPGYVPPGNFVFANQAVWNFGLATAGSAVFFGVLDRSILNFANVSASPAMQIENTVGGEAAFYGQIDGISVHGNLAGQVCAIGKASHADAFNGFDFNMEIKNASTSTSAIGLQVNGAYNCNFTVTSNCAGYGSSFVATEMAFCRVFGSFSNANIGLYLTSYYIFGNVFECLDLEVVNICVQIDSAYCSRNTWIGGQFAWSNGNSPITAINATAGSLNRFIGVNFASAGTIATNSVGVIAYGAGNAIGTETFGALTIQPLSGASALNLSAIAGQTGTVNYQTVAAIRWTHGKNNATESGSNVGSDFLITRYTDAGTSIDNPVAITRSSGLVTINTLAAAGIGFFGASVETTRPTVTGSKGGNAALTSLMTTLATIGLVTDSTT